MKLSRPDEVASAERKAFMRKLKAIQKIWGHSSFAGVVADLIAWVNARNKRS